MHDQQSIANQKLALIVSHKSFPKLEDPMEISKRVGEE